MDKTQLTKPLTQSIDDIYGKEHYSSAHFHKRVFKFALSNSPGTSNDFDPYCLKVYNSPFEKTRVGCNADGGYVIVEVPNVKYGLLLSAGVGPNISFELDFCKQYSSVPCLLFDGTVEDLPTGPSNSNIHFFKKNIGGVETCSETNWHGLLETHDNIFVKMDIEGGEFLWLHSLSTQQLSHISQVVLEVHNVKHQYHQQAIDALNKTHYLVHIHGNNNVGYTRARTALIPSVFECTFLNKKYFRELPDLNRTPFPTPLDFPNTTGQPELVLDQEPFVYNS